MNDAQKFSSTRPYLIRALHEWCTDNGFTPYLAVRVNDSVQVPREYVNNGEIVLNVSYDATSALQIGNDFIEFKARFNGKQCDILLPVRRVVAIYARENGQGMAFPLEEDAAVRPDALSPAAHAQPAPEARPEGAGRPPVQLQSIDGSLGSADEGEEPPPQPPGGSRPALKRIK